MPSPRPSRRCSPPPTRAWPADLKAGSWQTMRRWNPAGSPAAQPLKLRAIEASARNAVVSCAAVGAGTDRDLDEFCLDT